MFAARLVQLIEAHADRLSAGLVHRLKTSERCSELMHKVPADEVDRRTREVFHNLADWLVSRTESEIEERYVGLGARRARQGVPFSHFFWAMSMTKEFLWEYLWTEGLLEEPVELWGEMELLHSLELFFDRALYFAATGYENVHRAETVHAVARVATR
jgi:hypothetical protein